MKTIEKSTEEYEVIEELLGEHPETVQVEMVGGLECDEDDMDAQRELGDTDPIVALDLVAHWNPNTKEGILDWYCTRESTAEDEEPDIEHGGPLLAFRYDSAEPDLDSLLDDAAAALNETIKWAEFQLGEDENDGDYDDLED